MDNCPMNPAKELGCEKEIGSTAPGKLADIIVWDEELNRKTGLLLENDTGENNKDINPNLEPHRGGIWNGKESLRRQLSSHRHPSHHRRPQRPHEAA
jgi:predicted amidohydrolase